MKNSILRGRFDLPQSPFEINRSIEQKVDPTTAKAAAAAFRTYWNELIKPHLLDKSSPRIAHPQQNGSRVVIVGQYEITSDGCAKDYKKVAKDILHNKEAKAVIDRIGATAFNQVAMHTLPNEERLLLLQPPINSEDRGVKLLRAQRRQILTRLGDLAVETNSQKTPDTFSATLPTDISIPLAHFPSSESSEVPDNALQYVQEKLHELASPQYPASYRGGVRLGPTEAYVP